MLGTMIRACAPGTAWNRLCELRVSRRLRAPLGGELVISFGGYGKARLQCRRFYKRVPGAIAAECIVGPGGSVMRGSHPTAPLVTQRARCRGLSVARGRRHHPGKMRGQVDHDTSRGRQRRNLPLAAAPTPCARSWRSSPRPIPVWLPFRHFLRAAARRLGRDPLACVPRCS